MPFLQKASPAAAALPVLPLPTPILPTRTPDKDLPTPERGSPRDPPFTFPPERV